MNQSRLAWKVGLFVAVALGLTAALLVRFSKGASWFTPTYRLLLQTKNVGGIKTGASVLMAGVPVGTVEEIVLAPSGRDVTLQLKLLKKYPVHGDARFILEQAGFLGDQYVSIIAGENLQPRLNDGAIVRCEEPFNLQELARSATGFLRRVDATVAKLNDAVQRLDHTVLAERNLTNLTSAFQNLREASETGASAMTELDLLLRTNRADVHGAISNLVEFSAQLNRLADDAGSILLTNRDEVASAVRHLDEAGAQVNALLHDLRNGQGTLGGLLQDRALLDHLTVVSSNLALTTSRLNRRGLWGILWSPKDEPTNPPPRRILTSPKNLGR